MQLERHWPLALMSCLSGWRSEIVIIRLEDIQQLVLRQVYEISIQVIKL